jgi:hypothetical protein
MKAFKYKAFQILEPSFSSHFHRIIHEQNIYNSMIFILKTKKSVCQCVSPIYYQKMNIFIQATCQINFHSNCS